MAPVLNLLASFIILSSIQCISYSQSNVLFKGQFGFQHALEDIEPNVTLDKLWKSIEINRLAVMSKSISLAKYDTLLQVLQNSHVSLDPFISNEDTTSLKGVGEWTYMVTIETSYDDLTKTKVHQTSQMIEYFNLTSLTKDYHDKYLQVISITELLNKQQNQITLNKLFNCLSTNGWCFVKYPDDDFNTIQAILGKVKAFMLDNENDGWWYNEYYYEYSWYKKVLHILTGDIFDLYQYKYPLNILNELEVLSNIIDTLSMDIMNVLYKNIFGLNKLTDFIHYNVTLLNDPNNVHGLNHRAGMLDFVLYHNMDHDDGYDDDEEEEDMVHIPEHTDPGLFSLSFGSDNLGLQMFDIIESKWINVPNNYGVIWCGEIANTITNHVIKPGIHRVIKNTENRQPRFTGWYEVCINDQIWPYRKDMWPWKCERVRQYGMSCSWELSGDEDDKDDEDYEDDDEAH